MKQKKKLKKYCEKMLLDFELEDHLFIDGKYYEVLGSDVKLFDGDFDFMPDVACTLDEHVHGYVYEFCGRWYLQETGEEVSLKELKYIGQAKQKLPTEIFLGIHSGNELLNGVGLYKEWIKKAKFLGVKTLGICEKNTLAGIIGFQNECKANDIKPIFGMSLSVQNKSVTYDMKLYAKNFQGWLNLLKFNAIINVDEKLAVPEQFVMENLEGVIPILDPKTTPFESRPPIETFYQLDTVVFENEEVDIEYINNLEKYLLSDLEPITIFDAYYLEKADWKAREVLWGVAKTYDYKTKNQFFKNNDQYAKELITMFDPGDGSWINLYKKGAANLKKVAEQCNFEYDTVNRRLPKYVMTPEEAEQFKTKEELFLHLIKKGFKDRKITDADKYVARLKEEIRVLKKGDVLDYFLVLYDIIQFAKREGILCGIGRGSSGGSLVSYLLEIIQIDPLEFDLLFERFLNDGRLGSMEECKAYEINGELILNEGTMVKIKRKEKESIVFIEDLKEGDELIKYN